MPGRKAADGGGRQCLGRLADEQRCWRLEALPGLSYCEEHKEQEAVVGKVYCAAVAKRTRQPCRITIGLGAGAYCSSHSPPLRGADDTSSTGSGSGSRSLPVTPRPALQRSSDSADGGSGGGSDDGRQPGTPDQAPTRSSSVAVGDGGGIASASGNASASGSGSAGGNSGGGSDGSSQPDTPEQARQRSSSAAAEDGGGLSSSSGSKPNDCANPVPKLVGGRGSRGCVGTTTRGKPCRSKSDSYGGYCKPHEMQGGAGGSSDSDRDSGSCRPGNLRVKTGNWKQLKAFAEPMKYDSVRVSGVDGSRNDRCPYIEPGKTGWLKLWAKVCESESAPSCRAIRCTEGATAGGHVWLWGDNGRVDKQYCYIVPICDKHNHKQYDWPTSGFMTKPNTRLMRILPHACYKQVDYDVILVV